MPRLLRLLSTLVALVVAAVAWMELRLDPTLDAHPGRLVPYVVALWASLATAAAAVVGRHYLPLVAGSLVLALGLTQLPRASQSPATGGGEPHVDPDQTARVVHQLARARFVPLANVASEVDHDFPARPLSLEVPEGADGVLLHYAVHDALQPHFEGRMDFVLEGELAGGSRVELARRSLEVGKAASKLGAWHELSVELDSSKGHVVRVHASRQARGEARDPFPGAWTGIDPLDLALFSRPRFWSRRQAGEQNVLLISIDTLRADHMDLYGYRRKTTPGLSRWARDALVFEQTITQAPWTTPSHLAILSGTYPSTHGATGPAYDKSRLEVPRVPLLTELLNDHGYLSYASVGQASISARFGFYPGFAAYVEHPLVGGSDLPAVYDDAVAFLERHGDKKFFLFFHTYEPHQPYVERHFLEQEEVAEGVPTVVARYDSDIRRADQFVTRFLDELAQRGLAEHTLVVLTSDHGEELGDRPPSPLFDHGHSLFDDLLHVPLIVKVPGHTAMGRRVPFQVRSIDIVPTVLAALGLPALEHLQGSDLLSLVDAQPTPELVAVSEATTYGPQLRSLRLPSHKYIERGGLRDVHLLKYRGRPQVPAEQLYLLGDDPGERNDAFDAQQALGARYREQLHELLGAPANAVESTEAASDATDLSMSPGLEESLRELGYIQ